MSQGQRANFVWMIPKQTMVERYRVGALLVKSAPANTAGVEAYAALASGVICNFAAAWNARNMDKSSRLEATAETKDSRIAHPVEGLGLIEHRRERSRSSFDGSCPPHDLARLTAVAPELGQPGHCRSLSQRRVSGSFPQLLPLTKMLSARPRIPRACRAN